MNHEELDTPAELFGFLFHARDVTHLAHLKTKSYAEHVALGDFYDSLLDKTDALIEAYQGCYGIVPNIKIPSSSSDVKVIEYLMDLKEYLYESKGDILTESNLVNDIEEIISLISQTLYKLKNLS